MSVATPLKKARAAGLFSPEGLILRALLITVLFALLHLCGWREHTSVLAETVGSSSTDWHTSALMGLSYLAAYMAFVVGVPILLLAAAILHLINRLSGSVKNVSN